MAEFLRGLLWVALGSIFGGMTRYFVSGLVARRFGETFPWGTMVVNATGAFAIGILAAAASAHFLLHMEAVWQFAVVGFLGSYTTVSSFSLQTHSLAREGEALLANMNVLLSLVLCLAAVTIGFAVGSAVTSLVAS
jgi:CrcB protein